MIHTRALIIIIIMNLRSRKTLVNLGVNKERLEDGGVELKEQNLHSKAKSQCFIASFLNING